MSEWIKTILEWIIGSLLLSVLASLLVDYFKNKKIFKITCERLSTRFYKEKESDNVKISLSYKNEKVGDSLCVMVIRLTNAGRKDISFNQIFEDRIELIFKKLSIIDIKIEKQSDRVGAVINRTDTSRWFLSWGILKKKEVIELKIVAIYNSDAEELDENDLFINDLVFSFRGNNINYIDRIGPQNERRFIKVVMLSLLLLIATLPFYWASLRVKYDVLIDGQFYPNSSVNYNAYTKNYRIISDGKQVCKTTEIDRIELSQPEISTREFVSFFSTPLFIAAILLFYMIMYRKQGKSGFHKSTMYKLYRQLMSMDN